METLRESARFWADCLRSGPTLWGNQLNGNSSGAQSSSGQQGSVPTRWGNQLNGNKCGTLAVLHRTLKWPHSLGQSVEWKPEISHAAQGLPEFSWAGPTRWGNQLNGNSIDSSPFTIRANRGPTRWGNQLNGNLHRSRKSWD